MVGLNKKEFTYFGEDGLPLHAISLESESVERKSTIVFLHGGGPDHHSMIPLAQKFRENYRCILPDLRGYGCSVCRDEKCFTWDQYSNDLISLMDHIGVEDVVIVAAGIGTTISLKTAISFRKRIRGMVLISIEDIEDDDAKKKEIELLETFAACVKSKDIEAAWEQILSFLTPVIGHMVRDAIPRSDALSVAAAAAIVYDRAFESFEVLKDIMTPTLIIPGDDYRHPTALAASVAELLTHGYLSDVAISKDIRTANDFSNILSPTIQQFLCTLS